ncbi:hypothetical protein [Streptomyces sp. Wb2n-11]|uniref:MmyB family transcriptional regulator n=1 Tax=Streptomyces sp. Wb2n-11 TaxID=1030533 RepID=UPI00350E536A
MPATHRPEPCRRRCSTAAPRPVRPPPIARHHSLAPGAHHFFVDRDAAAKATVALLRAEADREPHDRALRELVGGLSMLSPEFRTTWAAHDVRSRHEGVGGCGIPRSAARSWPTTPLTCRCPAGRCTNWSAAPPSRAPPPGTG